MKQVVTALAVAGLFALVGCTRWNFLKPETKSPPPPTAVPSVAALVNYLDDNAQRIHTVRCTNLDMTCSAGMQVFGVRGKMLAQKPKNFLMSADTLGKTQVDLGSNDQEFWYWINKSDPPYQFHCSYKDLADGRVQHIPFPFQPDWIIEALGLGKYGPAERYKLEPEADTLKLVESARSPQGKPVRKVIVLNRRPVQPPSAQVQAYLLLDEATGKEICSAHISETQVDRPTGGILPRRVEFRWTMPNQKLKLAMFLDGVTVNPDVPRETFARRPLLNVPSYDLATGRVDGAAGLQRVQGRN